LTKEFAIAISAGEERCHRGCGNQLGPSAELVLLNRRSTAAVVELDVEQLAGSDINLHAAVGRGPCRDGDDSREIGYRCGLNACSEIGLAPALNPSRSDCADTDTDCVRLEAKHRAGRDFALK
jgi:hypothetical protein